LITIVWLAGGLVLLVEVTALLVVISNANDLHKDAPPG
jgi:hypothetical protein